MHLGHKYLGNPFAFYDLSPQRQADLMAWHEHENGLSEKEEEPEPAPAIEPIPAPNATGSADAWRRARIVLGL